ncbi:PIG-L family deacetylase [Spongiactinospora rosea]|uniref:PIG-L family deacetylase n=1 Tax=Spongiactinospora rosea TaxID=2248750 RepID=A0A366LYZ4_9ACTN|nr:PIG-L family deacetylase [Spongiactinospora rosea]RBQ18800.1 PIG-L family deacetylase [Spongiactinospora rosea]
MSDPTARPTLEPMPADWRTALAIVAHPDDLEYGTAAAIASWTDEGRSVSYLLATRGEAGIDTMDPRRAAPVREGEQRAAAAVVGVESVEFLGLADGTIEYGPALRRELALAIRRHRPELVITVNHHDTWPGGRVWNTPDHRAVGRAALDAAADAGNRWIFPEPGLAPWDGVRWVAVSGSPYPTHAVAAGPGLERAIASLLEHRSYIAALTGRDPREYARELLAGAAAAEGAMFGGVAAVAFELFPR